MAKAEDGSSVRSVCPYCGVGCGVVLNVRAGRIVSIEGDKTHPANRGRLCTKGKSAHEAVAATGRLATAHRRMARGGPLVPVALGDAVAETARRFRDILDRDGPDALGFYLSGQMSLEAQYLATKLAKGFVRTQHLESNSRLCMASAGTGYKLSLGADAPPGSYDDFDRTDLFLVMGANMADCHPILHLRMMDRVKAGAKLVVVDPRRTATADKADLHLPIRPGTDLALLNGLLHLVVAEGGVDAGFIAAHTEGWAETAALLADYPPARVAEITGLAETDIRRAAGMILAAPAFLTLWTMGLNQSVQGTFNTNAIVNLHLATGQICKPGSGPFSLTGQPNAMGGREMGYMGAGLPGQRSALVAADRAFCEARWGLPEGTIRAEGGDGTIGLFDRLAEGRVKALWVICTNPAASVADRSRVLSGLRRAEFVVTQDAFLETETNAHADIVLPAALSFEGDGVMVNSERNMTLTAKAVDAPGDALPDWALIAAIARAMGFGAAFDYRDAAEIFEEIKLFANPQTDYDLSGASHARLRQTPMQWPVAAETARARNPVRYLDGAGGLAFATASGKARFWARAHAGPKERPSEDYPLVLTTGRVQHQWHTMTKTGRVAGLARLNGAPFVEIHPADAARHGIDATGAVEIVSRRGRVVVPAEITDRIAEGTLFAPFHWTDLFGEDLTVNALTSPAVDPLSLQPEFKVAAVRIAPAPARAFVGGPYAHAAAGAIENDAADRAADAPLVLHASQTGTAEGAARAFAGRLAMLGRPARLAPFAEIERVAGGSGPIIVFAATFGDGEPPDGAAAAWAALGAPQAPRLEGRDFAVIAFGDSSYSQFCGFGRRLDQRLGELGGRRLADRFDCDAGDEDGLSAATARLLSRLTGTEVSTAPVAADLDARAEATGVLALNRRLSGPGGDKEVRQFGIRVEGALDYAAGDALGILPRNCPDLVAELLDLLALAPEAPVRVKGAEVALAEALAAHLEIARPTPDFLGWWAEVSGNSDLAARLADPDRARREAWLFGLQIADLVAFAPARVAAADFVARLRPLQPRLYSISSSPKIHPDEVHLTVSVVRHARHGRPRKGVASTFLADRANGTPFPVFVKRQAHFRPPADPGAPAIMIGPGTGIAPFRAFLMDREAEGASGANWLFFGERHRDNGFFYRDEIERWLKSGHLDRLETAFSRDQDRPIYVQHRMMEAGAEIWRWLDDGASVYVCGDATRMARDVDAALVSIVGRHGHLAKDAATDYVKRLADARRYCRDVY